MCREAHCSTCHKITWWGCGHHIAVVLDDIPEEEWCACEPKVNFEGKQYPPKASDAN
ncbi:hypothetical protein ASPWEDRAFT_108623 [Aspergillus wentii DTO 134E9]|uniref:Uncharacterized protein n=1 Tax=Aspergillus wentii DTO 134E9 TaxID=1073089 RepID=A0A1L9RS04_ASPWE|nr:uncharacterized protein ASPWEDRAFT_108623 [Aspergillus wentii DTO 134E9]KAI9930585.1 hypothetical protein MW887_011339 [Aspergillus wentii]OJJ37746.1 hypothetical protein ASPWEDRAFT_108623 [Aspergillus wentii DTO 134E9]